MKVLKGFSTQQVKIPHNKVEVVQSKFGPYKACLLTLRIDERSDEPYLILTYTPAEIGDYAFRTAMFSSDGIYKAIERRSNQDLYFQSMEDKTSYFATTRANKIVATRKELPIGPLTLINNGLIEDGYEFYAKCKFWYEDGHTEKPVYRFQLDNQHKLILNPKSLKMEATKPQKFEYKLIISPKDTTQKLELTDVKYVTQEGSTLLVVFTDGRTRNYPFDHIWYWEMQS